MSWKDKEDLEEKYKKKRKSTNVGNLECRVIAGIFIGIFLCLIVYIVNFQKNEAQDFINSPYNTRQDTFADRVIRGDIKTKDNEVVARTIIDDNGQEHRQYPLKNIYSHVVGFDTNGKSGIESEANFLLLSSHELFLKQMRNQVLGKKNMGDTVVTTLLSTLQNTAYNALGYNRGAIIALDPRSGRILAMVSKPDFDPNTIADNYSSLIADQDNSNLLNRVTNGAYPPGSIFKIVTALSYYEKHHTFDGFSFHCDGSFTQEGYTIHCYNNYAHGDEDLNSAFANSCNCAFSVLGLDVGVNALNRTARQLLFNARLPLQKYRQSDFKLSDSEPKAQIMQTAIGQGKTLVSPAHMAMIASAIANGGVLMKPYDIDHVENTSNDVIKVTKPEAYGRLMTENQANLLRELMDKVVTEGTARSLSGRGYKVAGKTGSAEFDDKGSSHSWFVGFAGKDSNVSEIAVAIIVENGGSGSESAVPIAAQLFDSYFYDKAY